MDRVELSSYVYQTYVLGPLNYTPVNFGAGEGIRTLINPDYKTGTRPFSYTSLNLAEGERIELSPVLSGTV